MKASLGAALLLLCSPLQSWAEASPAAVKAAAATLKRDSAGCLVHADIDACYDALRWNPADPALLIGLGDALMLANRPADAIRNYHRAAELAPDARGLAAKISTAEARAASRRAPRNPSGDTRQYSNAAPESQSH